VREPGCDWWPWSDSGKVRFLTEVADADRWDLERKLTQRSVDRRVRAYLGNAG
jgi:hypothetical protein